MNDKGTIALSAIAIGVSTAALLGVSSVANANEAEFCSLGSWCSLGYYPYLSGVDVQANIPWMYQSAFLLELEGYTAAFEGGYTRYGQCRLGPVPADPDAYCGCGGVVPQTRLVVTGTWPDLSYTNTYTSTPVFNVHDSECYFPG